jgi:hypothetical protein
MRWWWRRRERGCQHCIRLWFVDIDDYHVDYFINVWLYRLEQHGVEHDGNGNVGNEHYG